MEHVQDNDQLPYRSLKKRNFMFSIFALTLSEALKRHESKNSFCVFFVFVVLVFEALQNHGSFEKLKCRCSPNGNTKKHTHKHRAESLIYKLLRELVFMGKTEKHFFHAFDNGAGDDFTF